MSSLSRYKLKLSPDKEDTVVVQAVNLLDEFDAELNNNIMICREWYSWHFPELGTILTDNMQFIKTIKLIGMKILCFIDEYFSRAETNNYSHNTCTFQALEIM